MCSICSDETFSITASLYNEFVRNEINNEQTSNEI